MMMFKLHCELGSFIITADVLLKLKELKALATLLNYRHVTLFKCGIIPRILLNVVRAYIYARDQYWHYTSDPQDEQATKQYVAYEAGKIIIKGKILPLNYNIAKFY